MFNRPLLFLAVMAAAIGVPYVALDKNLSATATSQFNRLLGRAAGSDAKANELQGAWSVQGNAPSASQAASTTSTAAAPIHDLAEVFRFDLTPAWVTTRWPRVTTVLAETDLQGLRVPLVTGTLPDDLAGSLTYYFDRQHQLQRITFQGFTGDTRRLAAMCVNMYGLRPAPTLEAGYLLTEKDGQPVSTLRISHLPIVQATSPTSRAEIKLDLKRADAKLAPMKVSSTTAGT